ncbi:MAG TPA: enoyl-CoA hydratase-related protein [Steroidobacteraceae bacterium]|nr:enoyl-CoA hydratase-related protein [Steroidobacteraceae bacterium]
MDFSRYSAITLRRDGKVLHATMNRPEALNAVDETMESELACLFGDAAQDAESNVLVLTGAGRAFSAGGDVEQMQRLIDNPRLFTDGISRAKHLIHSILDCPKPVIAKVNGPAMGLGATMALFCDVIFAANHAKIADPHVKVGFVAGDGGAVIWPQLIGYARAKEYLLTGDALTGAQAAQIGLINHAVPAEDLDKAVDEFAQRLAAGAAQAVQWTKQSINIGLKALVTSTLDASIAYEALSNLTQDHQEAVNAFREKRPPRFTGQ